MKAEVFLSAAFGISFAAVAFLMCRIWCPEDALMLAVFSGLATYRSLLIYLLIRRRITARRYREAEKAIVSPVFYQTNGNFNLGKTMKNANIYFCEGGIVLLSLDEKPYAMEVLKVSDILRYECEAARLKIFTADNRLYVITAPDVQTIIRKLKEKGWIV